MPDGQVLEFTNVTKRFNEVTAVSDFSARVEPGAVTAFLGPNGAGKTTTLRILLGQVRPTSGTATIGGVAYSELRQPLRTIGSVLEETAYRPRRTASRQLTIAAKANGIPLSRVDEVIGMVGLDGEADSRIGGFSLGMRQRLSVAHALLGDPGALVFDEPANGLDPEGIRWIRLLMRRLADEGRTVLVSSHLLSEIEQVADNVLVLSKGNLVLASGIETLADPKGGSVVVDAADRAALTAALSAAGFDVEVLRSGLTVRGGDAGTVGAVAADAGIALSTLVQRGPTLEDVFIELVRGGRLSSRPGAATVGITAVDDAEAPGLPAAGVAASGIAAAGSDGIPAVAEPTVDAGTPGDASEADGEAVADGELGADGEGEAEAGVEREADAEAEVDRENESETEVAPDREAEAETEADREVEAEAEVEGEAEAGADREGETDDHRDGETDAEADGNSALESESLDEDASVAAGDVELPASAAAETPAPTRSFDEILFGASTTVTPAESEPEGTGHDAAEIFPNAGDAEPEGVASSGQPQETADETERETDGAHDEGEHAGVEFFSELDEAAGADAAPTDEQHAHDASESEGDDAESPEQDGENDPRSAAVSSMLAAAARAYYEDEPKDYPLSESSSADGAQWSVASTGVIDTVPLATSDEARSDEAEAETETGEHHEGEHHGEHHEGEHHGEHHEGEHHGEHHEGEHHGEHQEGEHHQGERHGDQHDGERHGDQHDGEHHGDQHHG